MVAIGPGFDAIWVCMHSRDNNYSVDKEGNIGLALGLREEGI